MTPERTNKGKDMKTLHRCHKCGKKLIDRNAQEVGMCLNCFAIEQSDFDEDEDEYNESEQFREPSRPSLQSKTAEQIYDDFAIPERGNLSRYDVILLMNRYAALRSEQDRKEIERLKDNFAFIEKHLGDIDVYVEVDILKKRNQELEEALRYCDNKVYTLVKGIDRIDIDFRNDVRKMDNVIKKALTKESAPSKEIGDKYNEKEIRL